MKRCSVFVLDTLQFKMYIYQRYLILNNNLIRIIRL